MCEYSGNVKFVRISHEFRTNFSEFRPICSFCSCIASCPIPLSQFVPCTLPHICRSRSPRGRRILGATPSASTSPGPDCPRSTPSPPKAAVATSPQAPVVDGRRARPAVCAVRGRGALDVREAASPTPPRGMWRARWWCPCRPATSWATPTPTPPWTGSPWPPGSRIRPGPSRCRPGPMGGSGTSVPCGTWSWSPGGAGHLRHLLPLPHCGQGGGGGQPACGAGAGGHV